MSICFNPSCPSAHNPDDAFYCQRCGSKLLLNRQYSAIKLLGQGGFGRTFLAVDTLRSQAEAACVIKQVLPQSRVDLASENNRFQQEINQLSLLGKHPQIPALLAHFEDESARYLVQEFVPGQNLETVLAQDGVFTEGQIRQLLADLLSVLRFIHEHQIVHRDIKPANIIRPANGQRYVLVDFGAAKSIVDSLTETGAIGSAGYVAPEQALGRATLASDFYSLGVTCIHLLTGIHPFDLYSVSEDRWVWRQYLTQPISMELRKVLDRLLQRATSQRYQSASAVLRDLRLEVAVAKTAPVAVEVPVSVGSISSQTTSAPASALSWHCIQTLTGHQAGVTAIALSPDGELIASGSTDKTIRLWSLATGELLYTWMGRSLRQQQGHGDRITALAFSPSSELLLSSSADGLIKQWDVRTGALIATLPNEGWSVSALALSPIEPLLASGSEDGLIQLWDLETNELIANVVQLDQPITDLKIDPAGQTLWSSSGKSICQWNLSNDQLLTTLKGHIEGVSALGLSANGCTLVSGGVDKLLKLWNLNTGQQLKLISAHRAQVNTVALHPSDAYFASASEDSTIKFWDLWTGQRLTTLQHGWGVNAMAFSPDGELLVSGSADETIKIWQQS